MPSTTTLARGIAGLTVAFVAISGAGLYWATTLPARLRVVFLLPSRSAAGTPQAGFVFVEEEGHKPVEQEPVLLRLSGRGLASRVPLSEGKTAADGSATLKFVAPSVPPGPYFAQLEIPRRALIAVANVEIVEDLSARVRLTQNFSSTGARLFGSVIVRHGWPRRPCAGKAIALELATTEQRILARQELTLNKYGWSLFEIPLAPALRAGEHILRISVDSSVMEHPVLLATKTVEASVQDALEPSEPPEVRAKWQDATQLAVDCADAGGTAVLWVTATQGDRLLAEAYQGVSGATQHLLEVEPDADEPLWVAAHWIKPGGYTIERTIRVPRPAADQFLPPDIRWSVREDPARPDQLLWKVETVSIGGPDGAILLALWTGLDDLGAPQARAADPEAAEVLLPEAGAPSQGPTRRVVASTSETDLADRRRLARACWEISVRGTLAIVLFLLVAAWGQRRVAAPYTSLSGGQLALGTALSAAAGVLCPFAVTPVFLFAALFLWLLTRPLPKELQRGLGTHLFRVNVSAATVLAALSGILDAQWKQTCAQALPDLPPAFLPEPTKTQPRGDAIGLAPRTAQWFVTAEELAGGSCTLRTPGSSRPTPIPFGFETVPAKGPVGFVRGHIDPLPPFPWWLSVPPFVRLGDKTEIRLEAENLSDETVSVRSELGTGEENLWFRLEDSVVKDTRIAPGEKGHAAFAVRANRAGIARSLVHVLSSTPALSEIPTEGRDRVEGNQGGMLQADLEVLRRSERLVGARYEMIEGGASSVTLAIPLEARPEDLRMRLDVYGTPADYLAEQSRALDEHPPADLLGASYAGLLASGAMRSLQGVLDTEEAARLRRIALEAFQTLASLWSSQRAPGFAWYPDGAPTLQGSALALLGLREISQVLPETAWLEKATEQWIFEQLGRADAGSATDQMDLGRPPMPRLMALWALSEGNASPRGKFSQELLNVGANKDETLLTSCLLWALLPRPWRESMKDALPRPEEVVPQWMLLRGQELFWKTEERAEPRVDPLELSALLVLGPWEPAMQQAAWKRLLARRTPAGWENPLVNLLATKALLEAAKVPKAPAKEETPPWGRSQGLNLLIDATVVEPTASSAAAAVGPLSFEWQGLPLQPGDNRFSLEMESAEPSGPWRAYLLGVWQAEEGSEIGPTGREYPALSLIRTSLPATAHVGEEVSYRVRVENAGSRTMGIVRVTVDLPGGFVVREPALRTLGNSPGVLAVSSGPNRLRIDLDGLSLGERAELEVRLEASWRGRFFVPPLQAYVLRLPDLRDSTEAGEVRID